MLPKINNRKAISVVLTTMIILVASVVLGTGVVIYGTSLFQTGAQQESIATQGVTLWVNATNTTGTNPGLAWGAAGIRNNGDKLVSVDTIQVRGASVPFTQWYVDKSQSRVTSDNFQAQYKLPTAGMNTFNGTLYNFPAAALDSVDCPNDWDIYVDLDGLGGKPTLCLQQASGPTSLNPGERMIVYFRANPGIFTPVDAGSASSVSIFAGKTGAPTSVTVGNP